MFGGMSLPQLWGRAIKTDVSPEVKEQQQQQHAPRNTPLAFRPQAQQQQQTTTTASE
jgi:hypothetical protein